MTASSNLDPFDMWRQMLGKLEDNINTMANDSMSSEQFNRTLGQLSEVSTGMRQMFDKALDGYFKALRVPSRTDISALAERLDRIEDKVDSLASTIAGESRAARPARTRRPPEDEAASDTSAKPASGKAAPSK